MNLLLKTTHIPLDEITEGVKESWKIKYGECYEIIIDGKVGYFRNVTKGDIVSGSLKRTYGKDVIDTAVKTLKLFWLGGDRDEFLNDHEYARAACDKFLPLLENKLRKLLPNKKF
jgi:hypothetical protein